MQTYVETISRHKRKGCDIYNSPRSFIIARRSGDMATANWESEFDINTRKLLEGRENREDFNAIGFN